MILEGMRDPQYNLMLGGIRVSQLVGFSILACGVVLMTVLVVRRKKKAAAEEKGDADDEETDKQQNTS